ncbi:MAG TPA: YfiR family protein [Candidatus Acidoferrales bacterium]|nr:YfiR family protein [Candidatus Acidoferrales bacterium]
MRANSKRKTDSYSLEMGECAGASRKRATKATRKIAALFLIAFTMGAAGGTAQQTPSEYQLKAAFLFNFAKFVDWPPESFANPQAPFAICVLGKDPFGRALDDLSPGKTIGERPVVVERLKDAHNAKHCQVVFVSGSESRNLAGILEGLRGTNALTVGDSNGFAVAGGAIQFTVEENHVRFLINPEAGERAGLKFSSKLLALAKIVHEPERGGKS